MDSQGDGWDHAYIDNDGVLRDLSDPRRVSYGRPPVPRGPLHVTDVPTAIGRRLVLMTNDGPIIDLRAASDVWADDAGQWISIAEEWRWYAWQQIPVESRPPRCPRTIAHPVINVWVE